MTFGHNLPLCSFIKNLTLILCVLLYYVQHTVLQFILLNIQLSEFCMCDD